MPFYRTPEQDDYNKIPELQACIAKALYDVDSIPGTSVGAIRGERRSTPVYDDADFYAARLDRHRTNPET